VARGPCFNCGQKEHFAKTTPARQNQARARVNPVTVEDVQEALDVIIGMILVNDNNVIVLFDSGASHSFVATNFVQKYDLPLFMLKNQMIISSPGRDMHASLVCPKANILIRGTEFIANLIVLESKGIDVILGMDWLNKHKGMINCAKKAVRLTTSNGKEVEYVAENLVTDKAASNIIVLNHLDAASTLDIRTASEFSDVFPEELLGMPPDREIEFVIELVPGTTTIFKKPYRMSANQLVELKEQL
jgi:hypothetical protein